MRIFSTLLTVDNSLCSLTVTGSVPFGHLVQIKTVLTIEPVSDVLTLIIHHSICQCSCIAYPMFMLFLCSAALSCYQRPHIRAALRQRCLIEWKTTRLCNEGTLLWWTVRSQTCAEGLRRLTEENFSHTWTNSDFVRPLIIFCSQTFQDQFSCILRLSFGTQQHSVRLTCLHAF